MFRTCPSCQGSSIVQASTELTMVAGGQAVVGAVAVDRCQSCGEETISVDDLRDFEARAVRTVIAKRIVNGGTLQFIRKFGLAMSVSDVATCVGITSTDLAAAERATEVKLHLWRAVATMALQILAGTESTASLLDQATTAVSVRPLRIA
jgi:YgiT-type zinc finger domain-containing protein